LLFFFWSRRFGSGTAVSLGVRICPVRTWFLCS